MKKLCAVMAAGLVFAAVGALAVGPQAISIKLTKKTEDTERDSDRARKGATVSHEVKRQYYNIEIDTMSQGLPANVIVKWLVLVEDPKGRPYVGTRGEKDTPLKLNRTSEVQTDTFTLEGASLNKPGKLTRERDSDLRGVGVRVCDDAGHILAEKYEPKSAEKDLVAMFDEKRKER